MLKLRATTFANIRSTLLFVLTIGLWAMANIVIGADVLITNSRVDSPTQLMDLNWKRAANLVGLTNEIIPHDHLDDLSLIQDADILIITSGVENISNDQRSVVLEFIKGGGHVYVQSEFRINFSGNQLFEYLVNKSGGTFAWEGETNSNLNPSMIPSYIQDDNSPSQLNYFWNGTYGCGGEQVFSLIAHQDKDYGFLFIPNDDSRGRIMTTTDQDWIKIATETGQSHRLQYMRVLLDALANGIDDLVVPDVRINFLQQSACPETPFDLEALIDDTALEYEIDWYKNGVAEADWFNKKSFSTTDVVEGDIVQAKLNVNHGCDPRIIASNFVEIERVYPLNMDVLNIKGDAKICAGDQGVFSAEISAMPDPSMVNYTWKINDVDQQVDNDTLLISNPLDETKVTLEVTYDNMCQMINKSADNSMVIKILGNSPPNISLTRNKEIYCMNDMAMIMLEGLPDDIDATITWTVNGNTMAIDDTSYVFPSLTNNHEIYASISYVDDCDGAVQLSTQVVSIIINQPTLKISDKQNTSCDLDNGSITVLAEGGTVPFTYSWNDIEVTDIVSNLPIGNHMITLKDANDCEAEVSTSIGASNPIIIDSIVISDSSCDTDEMSSVQLYTNPSFMDALNITWADGNGATVDLNVSGGSLAAGNYTVKAEFNEDCSETKAFEIQDQDFIDRLKTNFAVEAEYFTTLDLGVPVAEIASIVWSDPNDMLDCTDCTWPSLLATKSQTFKVNIITTAGCAVEVDVDLKVSIVEKLPYFAPSGFSPDGDGVNDTYEFFVDQSIAELKELLIFDRWGNIAYIAKSVDEVNWDGKINGKTADKGVFAYVAKLVDNEGKEIIASGSIMLVR